MTTYTKSTITTYELQIDQVSEAWLADILTKTEELAQAGKTDGNYAFIDEHTVKRVWLDQAAVDEWITWFTPSLAAYGLVVTNIQVIDNPSGTL